MRVIERLLLSIFLSFVTQTLYAETISPPPQMPPHYEMWDKIVTTCIAGNKRVTISAYKIITDKIGDEYAKARIVKLFTLENESEYFAVVLSDTDIFTKNGDQRVVVFTRVYVRNKKAWKMYEPGKEKPDRFLSQMRVIENSHLGIPPQALANCMFRTF